MTLRIAFGLALTMLALLVGSSPTSATVYGFNFEPKHGGPGTKIEVYGTVPHDVGIVTVELGIAEEYYQHIGGSSVTRFTPVVVVGKVTPNVDQHCCELPFHTTVILPRYSPDGLPILKHELAIRIVDPQGDQIRQTQSYFFEYDPSALPPTGRPQFDFLLPALVLLLTTIVGAVLRVVAGKRHHL